MQYDQSCQGPCVLLFCPEPLMAKSYAKAARSVGRTLVVVTPSPLLFSEDELKLFPWHQGESISQLAARINSSYGPGVRAFTTSEIFLPQFAALIEHLSCSPHESAVYTRARDKWAMKAAWNAAQVTTAKAELFTDATEASATCDRDYPAIIKPRIGFASAGVRKVHDQTGYVTALKNLSRVNRLVLEPGSSMPSGVMVEEFIDGPEFAIDSLWSRGEARAHFVMSREPMKGDTFPDTLYYLDPDLDPALRQVLCQAAFNSGKALGVTHGTTHTEMRVVRDHHGHYQAYVIEGTPRAGAGGLFHFAFSKAFGIDSFALALLAELPEAYADFDRKIIEWEAQSKNVAHPLIYYYQPPRTSFGTVERVVGDEELRQRDFILRTDIFCKPGSILLKPELSLTYWAWIMGQASCTDELKSQIRVIDETIGVIYR